MTTSQAILAGSLIIAGSIVAAALVLPDRAALTPTESLAYGQAATREASAPRFQIVKVEQDMSWRLDTHTGEVTVCRLENDRLVCARSTEAAELPPVSPQELEAERQQRREAKRAERNEVFDGFIAFFERIIRFAEKHSGLSKPPAPDDKQMERL
jgi:hypothetical protein